MCFRFGQGAKLMPRSSEHNRVQLKVIEVDLIFQTCHKIIAIFGREIKSKQLATLVNFCYFDCIANKLVFANVISIVACYLWWRLWFSFQMICTLDAEASVMPMKHNFTDILYKGSRHVQFFTKFK